MKILVCPYFKPVFLVSLSLIVGCSPNGYSSIDDSKLKDEIITPVPIDPTSPNTPTSTVIGVTSGSSINSTGTNGSKAQISMGESMNNIEVKTQNGYRAYLNISGQTHSQ